MSILSMGAALALTLGSATALPGLDVHLVKDLDTRPDPSGALPPREFRTIGDAVYFAAAAPATGSELYRTDGTPGGLSFVADIIPGPESSNPTALGFAGPHLIVEAGTAGKLAQLWSVSGGASVPLGTTDKYMFGRAGSHRAIGNVGGRLIVEPIRGGALWSTDGTVAGTQRLTSDPAFPVSTVEQRSCFVGGVAVAFGRVSTTTTTRIIATDGTVAGTTTLATLTGYYVTGTAIEPLVVDGRCHLLLQTQDAWHLWSTDGTVAGTQELRAEPGLAADLAAIGSVLYVAESDRNGFRVKRFAPAGEPLETIIETQQRFDNFTLIETGSRIAFSAPYGTGFDLGLYISDGTSAGTTLVYPTQPGDPRVSYPSMVVLDGQLVFWPSVTSGGTAAPVRFDLATGARSPGPSRGFDAYGTSAKLGNQLVGSVRDAEGVEVWLSDGTPTGTQPLHDVAPRTVSGLTVGARSVTAANGNTLYFNARFDGGDDDADLRLWRTDGDAATTHRLDDAAYNGGAVVAMVAHGDGVLFRSEFLFNQMSRYYAVDAAFAGATAVSPLLRSSAGLAGDGDDAYFGCLDTINPDVCHIDASGQLSRLQLSLSHEQNFLPVGSVGDVVIFHNASSSELWRTNGTAPGTFRIAQNAGFGSAGLAHDGKLYFGACLGAGNCGIAMTDGTAAGTIVLPAPTHQFVSMARVGTRILFGFEGVAGPALWATDGTASGTLALKTWPASPERKLSAIAVAGDTAHVFAACTAQFCTGEAQSWLVTDGTSAGTRFAPLPSGIRATSQMIGALGDAAIAFACQSTSSGVELCAADRDGGSVEIAADIYPGLDDSNPRALAAAGDALYFVADDGMHGSELWTLRAIDDAIFASGFE